MPASPRVRIDTTDATRIVRFNDRQLFDDRTVREVTEQILLILPELHAGEGLVLDFSGVATLSSSMIGKLVLLQRHIDTRGARLRLCELNEAITTVMRTTNLDRIFSIDRDLRESLAVLAGQEHR